MNVSPNYSVQHLYQKLVGKAWQTDEEIKLTLFIVSTKDSTIKALNLSGLSRAERAEALKNRSQEDSFVAVIQRGDEVYAHINPIIADELQKQSEKAWPMMSLGGKKVKVEVLDSSEYAELSKIGQDALALEELLAVAQEQPAQKDKDKASTRISLTPKRPFSNLVYLMREDLINRILLGLENKPQKIKSFLLKKWQENIEEIKRQSVEEDKKVEKRHWDIKHREEERSIRRNEIQQEAIQEKQANLDIMRDELNNNR